MESPEEEAKRMLQLGIDEDDDEEDGEGDEDDGEEEDEVVVVVMPRSNMYLVIMRGLVLNRPQS